MRVDADGDIDPRAIGIKAHARRASCRRVHGSARLRGEVDAGMDVAAGDEPGGRDAAVPDFAARSTPVWMWRLGQNGSYGSSSRLVQPKGWVITAPTTTL